MMKKPQTYYAIGFFAIAVVLIAGLLALPKSWSATQINQSSAKTVTEKAEKINVGMPLWHAIPRFLFRRY